MLVLINGFAFNYLNFLNAKSTVKNIQRRLSKEIDDVMPEKYLRMYKHVKVKKFGDKFTYESADYVHEKKLNEEASDGFKYEYFLADDDDLLRSLFYYNEKKLKSENALAINCRATIAMKSSKKEED